MASRCPGPDGREARRIFIGMWNLAEDHGVLRGNPSYIRAELYPYDEDVTTADVARTLAMLERGGFIVRFERQGSTYYWVRGFADHQRINHPSKPTFPEPSEEEKGLSPPAANALPEPSRSPPLGLTPGGGKEVEVEREKEVEVEAPPPTAKFIPLVFEKPAKPEEDWDDEDFENWVQYRRQESGYLPEKRVNFRKRSAWWSECRMSGATAHSLKEGFYRFGQDPHWEAKDPPFPFAAFMSQWRKYTRLETANARAS